MSIVLEQIANNKISFPGQGQAPWVEPYMGQYDASAQSKLLFRYWPARQKKEIEPKFGALKLVVKPVVIYLHGIEGHSEWFQGTASSLAYAGIDVYAPDRRGAGLNPCIEHYRYGQLLDDLELFVAEVSRQNPGSPIFLLANCWGAKIAIALFLKRPVVARKLCGLILTSPAVKTKVDLTVLDKIRTALSKYLGVPASIEIPIDPEMFTDTELYLNYINNDALRLTKVDSSFFAETFFLSFHLFRAAQEVRLPLLLVQSSKDDIVQIQSVKDWFSQVKSKQKELYIIQDCAHSVDFQIDNTSYWNKLTDFIWQSCEKEGTC